MRARGGALAIGVTLAAPLAACDEIYGLTGRTDPGASDGARDSVDPDATPINCEGGTLSFDESFSGPKPCEPWAYPFEENSVELSQLGGRLRITPTGADTKAAGCTTDAMMFPRAMIAEVRNVVDPQLGYTFIGAGNEDSIKVSADMLGYESSNGGTIYVRRAWQPSEARFWRLEQINNERVASFSPNGVSWTELGRRPAQRQSVVLGVVAGLAFTSTSPGIAELDRLVVCQ